MQKLFTDLLKEKITKDAFIALAEFIDLRDEKQRQEALREKYFNAVRCCRGMNPFIAVKKSGNKNTQGIY